jgi:hypothetical protein
MRGGGWRLEDDWAILAPMKLLPLTLLITLHTVTLPALPAVAGGEAHSEFNLKEEDEVRLPGRGNLLNLIFGSPPPRASERGILLIDAFHDRNGDGRRNPGEEELQHEVFCLVDKIEYDVPAFIPGLSFQGNFKVLCAGERFEPALTRKEVFIERRGEIVHLDIPCSPVSAPAIASPL